MITPEWLDMRLNMLSVHKELQESILRDMVRRILKTNFTVTDTAAWQAEKLQQSGMLYDNIITEVSIRTDRTAAEVRAAFKAAETEVFNYDNEALESAGIDPRAFRNISPMMKSILFSAGLKTYTAAKNITKTTAVTTQTAFVNACDVAHMQIASGAFSYNEAIRQAVKSAAVQGFKVRYPTGRASSLDAAVRRAVLTGVNQTCGKLQELRADEYEVDLMETTAHFGARPTHAEWQGQVVSRSGRSGYLSLDDIGYGAVDGFMGANCRHNWHMYFEGYSRRAYTPEQLENLKNETVTYEGEEMPVWQARERQRAMERSVRRYKQELVAYDEAAKNTIEPEERIPWQAEFNDAAAKLKRKEAEIKDFCEQTGLQRETSREQVFATATENGIKGFGKSVSGKAVQAFEKQKLPNYKEAVIAPEKLTGYALNKNHPFGKDKAIAFEKYLGYTLDNAELLDAEIRKGLNENIAKARTETEFGKPYEVRMIMKGINGKKAKVKTGWIIDKGKQNPRLTSVYIFEKGNGKKK